MTENNRPNVLLSNDDGIFAEGIRLLHAVLAECTRVTVVAPDSEQSSASHALTMFRPLRLEQLSDDRYQVDGTPTDCVLLGLDRIFETPPACVFSGINHGQNLGEDVLYSGTVAAAMEGLTSGIPGIAFSFAGRDISYLKTQEDWIRRIVIDIVHRLDDFPEETLLSINLPPIAGADIRGVRVTTLGRRVYEDSVRVMKDPWGRALHWIGGGRVNWSGGSESDFQAIADGYISVTPLHIDLTNHQLLDQVRQWNLG